MPEILIGLERIEDMIRCKDALLSRKIPVRKWLIVDRLERMEQVIERLDDTRALLILGQFKNSTQMTVEFIRKMKERHPKLVVGWFDIVPLVAGNDPTDFYIKRTTSETFDGNFIREVMRFLEGEAVFQSNP